MKNTNKFKKLEQLLEKCYQTYSKRKRSQQPEFRCIFHKVSQKVFHKEVFYKLLSQMVSLVSEAMKSDMFLPNI